MSNIETFIEVIESQSHNSAKVVKSVFKNFNEDIIDFDIVKFEQFILDQKPSSPKAITTICYILRLYAKWLFANNIVNSNELYDTINNIDEKLLWQAAKPHAKKKYISYAEYQNLLYCIERHEELNTLYFSTLFRCIYEGVCNNDLSVIKNLRASDIDNNILTLHDDNGTLYKLAVSNKLAQDLKELSLKNTLERANRFGVFEVDTKGPYADSVFKIEYRNRETKEGGSYKHTYYTKIREKSMEYIGSKLSPSNLYVSGMMYRIKHDLAKNNISLESAFSDNNRNSLVHSIILKELNRCHSSMSIGNFREQVKGHLDVFDGENFNEFSDNVFLDILDIHITEEDDNSMAYEESIQQDCPNEFDVIKSIEKGLSNSGLEGKEQEIIIKARVNQSKFRQQLLDRYKKCCLCSASNPDLLIASHIKPWCESEPNQKLDIENGFLLCPNHDKLFDSGLISFDNDGKIMISDKLSEADREAFGVNENIVIDLTDANKEYLKHHRQKRFKNR